MWINTKIQDYSVYYNPFGMKRHKFGTEMHKSQYKRRDSTHFCQKNQDLKPLPKVLVFYLEINVNIR